MWHYMQEWQHSNISTGHLSRCDTNPVIGYLTEILCRTTLIRTSPDVEPRHARKIRCLTALTGRAIGHSSCLIDTLQTVRLWGSAGTIERSSFEKAGEMLY